MEHRRAFVTGGAGFVGSSLVERLVREQWHVLVYDNFSTGKEAHLPQAATQLEYVSGDLNDAERLTEAMSTFQPDVVFHLAAIHYIPYCNAHPTETVRVNVEGTASVLEACKQAKPARVVVASTGAVYPIKDGELPETLPPGPTDIYGVSKHMTEQLVELFQRRTNIDCVIARLFNVYGPRETNPHLIPEVLEQIVSGARAIKLGNLEPKRDYIYVEDVATTLFGLANVPAERINGLIRVNVATGAEFSVREVFQAIQDNLEEPIEIVQDPARMRPSDRPHQLGDITLLRELLGWTPSTDLKGNLRKTIEWTRSMMEDNQVTA